MAYFKTSIKCRSLPANDTATKAFDVVLQKTQQPIERRALRQQATDIVQLNIAFCLPCSCYRNMALKVLKGLVSH